jgi:hypothetical protein
MVARASLCDAIAKHKRAELSTADLCAKADAYIAEIRAHGLRIGRKVPVPSRAHIIRALS